jgi:ankyrin repeat protein
VRLLPLVTGKAYIDTKDGKGQTPLSYAAEKGHKAVMRLLLDWGACTKAADNKGRTPLLYAAKRRHEPVMQLLLDWGAYIEAADKL